jgi:hypothetical protein
MQTLQLVLLAILVALTLWGLAFSLTAPLQQTRGSTAAVFVECLPFQNVVATGKATINFANLLGYTVEYILLELGGTAFTKSMIADIDIKANAKTIFKSTGARTDDRMEYRGETADAAYLVLSFDESRARCEVRNGQVIDGEKIGSIDTTFGIQSLTGEIDISGATAPTLKAYAELSAAPIGDARFRALIAKVFNFTVSPSASGTFAFDVPYGRSAGSIVKRIFLHGSTVTGAEVKKNGITIFKAASVALNTYHQKREGRVPQTNVFCIDFIKDMNQSAALNAADAQTIEYYMTVSGSGNVVVEVELYDPLNNN